MNSATARLVLRYGPFPEEEFPLPTHTTTIGREPVNDLSLGDAEISRRHARIMFQAGRYLIEDLGSTNGTFVNGRRIQEPTVLNPGDVVDFAEFVGFTFINPVSTMADTFMEGNLPQTGPPAAARHSPVAPYSPTAATTQQPFEPATRPPLPESGPLYPAKRGTSRTAVWVGCGCLFLFLLILCYVTPFLLDTFAPNFLYCGPLQPLLERAGLALECPILIN